MPTKTGMALFHAKIRNCSGPSNNPELRHCFAIILDLSYLNKSPSYALTALNDFIMRIPRAALRLPRATKTTSPSGLFVLLLDLDLSVGWAEIAE